MNTSESKVGGTHIVEKTESSDDVGISWSFVVLCYGVRLPNQVRDDV
jgi:hypothetical protein